MHIIFQCTDVCTILLVSFISHLQRFGEPHYPVNIFSARTHIPFLCSTMNDGADPYIFVDIKHAYTFWSMELMGSAGGEMNWRITQVKWEMTNSLHCIAMENGII